MKKPIPGRIICWTAIKPGPWSLIVLAGDDEDGNGFVHYYRTEHLTGRTKASDEEMLELTAACLAEMRLANPTVFPKYKLFFLDATEKALDRLWNASDVWGFLWSRQGDKWMKRNFRTCSPITGPGGRLGIDPAGGRRRSHETDAIHGRADCRRAA